MSPVIILFFSEKYLNKAKDGHAMRQALQLKI